MDIKQKKGKRIATSTLSINTNKTEFDCRLVHVWTVQHKEGHSILGDDEIIREATQQ